MSDVIKKESCCGTIDQSSSTAFPRVNRLLDRFFDIKPQLCIERALAYTKSYKETEGEATVIRRAKAFKRACEEKSIFIADDELIVGCAASVPRAAVFCPEHATGWLREELDDLSTRRQDPYDVTEDQKKVLREEIFPYWEDKDISSHWLRQIPDEVKEIAVKTGIIDIEIKTQSGPGEISPNVKKVLQKGFLGIRQEACEAMNGLDIVNPADYEKKNFYEAVCISLDGVMALAGRYAKLAREKAAAEASPQRKAELLQIAENLEHVPANPARTFMEALQSFWILQICCYIEANGPSYSPGRVDQLFYPYYRRDTDQGKLTDDKALELIECLYLKFAENTWFLSTNAAMYFAGYQPYQNTCVGGINRDGKDATNELSYLFITAKMEVRLHSPSLSVRVHKQSPEKFLRKVAELSQIGTGFPAIHNDEVTIKMMLMSGAGIEDARDYCMVGCVEPYIPGKMSKWTDGGHYNYGSVMELALTNGVSVVNGNRRLGVETGDSTKMSFEELKSAVKEQLAFCIKHIATACHICEKQHAEYTPYPYMSSMIDGCIESGTDITRGGAELTVGPAFIGTGIADLADSLSVIKEFVFDKKVIKMEEIVEAVKNNFAGHEDLRAFVESNGRFYGNDDDYVDEFVREMTDYAFEQITSYQSYRGPHYISGLYPVASHVPHGEVVAALPYGRLQGTPLADGCSPKGGTDVKGPTAVLKSVSKINHDAHVAGTLLNMRLDPMSSQGEEGNARIVSLIKSFIDLNIYHVQFNIISSDILKRAQESPHNYKSLIVRVAGYSAFFTELCKEMQDDIIQRTVQEF
ncbi:glycyl radical protein [Anaerovorax odorimutans]|uniref:Glycyl radical protein n=1 Tax=Anaerovorax odorimutans TaxID=109327 RepID=A0ABT1RJM1_9FIRM|nr:glycyl radical protein [Anaerovorax odorimutans]MCQ4635375.1 glycyl radical protein [Anaerovorax odorimutans]